jgi:hypothetical protein
VRAVRKAGTTTGLELFLASTNAGGKPGPPGQPGAAVQATITTDGAGNIAVGAGATGVAGVAIVVQNGIKQIQVTFASSFDAPTYSLVGNWFSSGAVPAVLNNLAFDFAAPPNVDGRGEGDVIFLPVSGAGAPVDPSTTALTIMVACIGDP